MSLVLAAAACELAQAIHRARSAAYGIPTREWRSLPTDLRHRLVDEALLLIELHRPATPGLRVLRKDRP